MALIWSTSSGATGISLCRWTIGCTSKPMTAEPRISTFGICSLGQTNEDRKSTRLNSSHSQISYAVFCLKKKKLIHQRYILIYLCESVVNSVLFIECVCILLAAPQVCFYLLLLIVQHHTATTVLISHTSS